jgi:acetate kinase
MMATCINGIDVLVFTGGIGENSADVRKLVCARLAWLGLRLDEAANTHNRDTISTRDSRFAVRVIPTDEQWVIAAHTRDAINGKLQTTRPA